ncbi:PHOP2 phosphatase, partial [Penelope pileata]|nr:PHOP2 phosphatase [Penelope pileata]
MKLLLVFDFDHTIVDENSDTWVVRCAPKQQLPHGLRSSCRPGHWTEYMGRVLAFLGDSGVREDDMRRTMTAIPFTAGMEELLGFLGENKAFFDCIIISDSNTVFIDWILKAADFHAVFDAVFTNPAVFSSAGWLTLRDFHAHHCPKCPKNLCKRKVLKEFLDKQLERGVSYRQVVYIGDGGNDLCPVTFLGKDDVAMPRHGYTLEKKIAQLSRDMCPVECSVLLWSSAVEIMSYLKLLIKE